VDRKGVTVFEKVLIANRGEIARRVLRTCRRLGIATVAVYSEADAAAPHVREADEAILLGPAPATESYLRVDAILEAARRTGADAVHPGYGFLSENAAFAEACAAAGLVFIGPSAAVIRLMGDKAAAKAHLAAAGVPVLPGFDAAGMDDAAIAAACEDVGYPLLVKAVAGGGGKGMRTVTDPAGLTGALAAARREASAAFGDDRVLIERLVSAPRHVEIQVFGDTHGNVVHLFERECSIQRRHQKIVEETPSPAVDAPLRERMGAAAVTAAAAVDYVGAGTVEFLLAPTASDGGAEFFFLEMNTRLQVEHPVTELVTGEDLVEWQLRVAAGEPLPRTQDELRQDGHAIEARLYAEDVPAGFLPQTGPVRLFAPPTAPDVRVDAGIETGSEVSRFYDPMLAKLVVHAADRETAIERLLWLLDHTPVLGVTTNIEHLAAVVDHPRFRAGDVSTHFIDDHLPDWQPAPLEPEVLVATAVGLQWQHEAAPPPAGDPHSPWHRLGPWRTGGIGGWQVRLRDGDRDVVLAVTGPGERYRVELAAARHEVTIQPGDDGLRVAVDGRDVPLALAVHGNEVWVHTPGRSRRLGLEPPTRHVDPARLVSGAVFTSPMPGAVIAVNAAAGATVSAGTTLLVVEAMKMEHPIVAPTDGTVTAIHVALGDAVEGGQPLLDFEPEHEDTP
jgi:acetyl-CoA carboxylase biotin carboxylase subunit